jgi:hypothetical protein
MEPIRVPAPPPNAFNKNRPPSDLLLSQLKYFQHLELKLGHKIDPEIRKNIHTEDGASRYIAAMTRLIRGQSGLTIVPSPKPSAKPLALAASATKPKKRKK